MGVGVCEDGAQGAEARGENFQRIGDGRSGRRITGSRRRGRRPSEAARLKRRRRGAKTRKALGDLREAEEARRALAARRRRVGHSVLLHWLERSWLWRSGRRAHEDQQTAEDMFDNFGLVPGETQQTGT